MITEEWVAAPKIIRREGDRWCLWTSDGSRKLGCHDTREEALAQERAVQANKGLTFPIFVEEEQDLTITADILKQNDERRLVYGIVLVPFKRDTQGDVFSDVQIMDAAHEFMLRGGEVRDMHRRVVQAKVVESVIVPPGGLNWYGTFIPEGSWAVAIKVFDEVVWQAIKSGARRGLSARVRGKKIVQVAA
jgi:hypothetical protein